MREEEILLSIYLLNMLLLTLLMIPLIWIEIGKLMLEEDIRLIQGN